MIFNKNFEFIISDSTNAKRRLFFDSIHQGESSELKFVALIPYLNAFDTGESACVINHGVTGK